MIQGIMRICPLEATLFHVDRLTEGRIDVTKPIFALCNLLNTPKNDELFLYPSYVPSNHAQKYIFFSPKFMSYRAFFQVGRGSINAMLKPIAFGVIYNHNDVKIISKDVSVVN
jgi:hypothetical protein